MLSALCNTCKLNQNTCKCSCSVLPPPQQEWYIPVTTQKAWNDVHQFHVACFGETADD
jgi:hypothetical protein